MARKTAKERSKASGKGKGKKPSTGRRFPGLFVGLLFFGGIGAILSLLFLFPKPEPSRVGTYIHPPFEEARPTAPPRSPAPAPPGAPKEKVSPPLPPIHGRPADKHPCPFPGHRPALAIIIDDMGHDYTINRALLDLECPLSFAFLPYARHTKKFAKEAHERGRDVLVHLPMEPRDPTVDPGPGVLLTGMDPDMIVHVLDRNLAAVPFAVGVNNHMGSRFTADRRGMEIVLAEVKRKGLFFVDSRTTADSVAMEVADSLAVPALERAVFLDDDPRPEAVSKALRVVADIARHHGFALAIGHPYKSTYEVLSAELPSMRSEMDIVPVSRLIKMISREGMSGLRDRHVSTKEEGG